MPIQVKDIAAVAAKWSTRAAAAGADYTAGVKAPRNDWATNTAAAQQAWKDGVTAAVGSNRFASGVAKAGTPKWQTAAVNKGASRYPDGVSKGQGNYSANFGPVLQVIAGLNLPPRSPRGSPANLQRVGVVNTALHTYKIGQ